MRHSSLFSRLSPLLIVTSLLVLTWTAAAQEDLTDHPGFVDFSKLDLFGEDEMAVNVSVKDPMLKLVAEVTRGSDPDLADMLGRLRLIEVRVYEATDTALEVRLRKIRQIAKDLESRGWETAMTLRSGKSQGFMYLKLADGKPLGLAAAFVGEENEAVFVNIVGEIDPTQVGRLAAKFSLDELAEATQDAPPPEKP